MLSALIRFALSQRLLVFIITATAVGLGYFSFQELPIDAYPDISTTQVQIIVKAPGMTPQEVESRVTRPLETTLRGIENQTGLRSLTKYALAVITIDFAENTDIYWARTQISERIGPILSTLPSTVEAQLAPITTPLSDIYMFLVEGEGYDSKQLRDILEWQIRPRLLSVAGVADVNVLGGRARTFEIRPRYEDLKALSISLDEIAQAVQRNNRNVSGDRISVANEVLLVQTHGQLQNIDDLRYITVAVRGVRTVRLFEVADVVQSELPRYGGVTANGRPDAVEGIVLLRRGANGRKTVDGVKAEIERITKILPRGVRIVPFYDRSMLITKAVDTVTTSLIQAIVLVLIVLALFLGNIRSAITSGMILPISIVIVFLIMRILGITANLMSLGGLAIAIGILVDSSVVVTENMHIFLGKGSSRLPLLHHIFRAVREVGAPVLTAAIIIVASLLPVWTLQGIEGRLFSPLAATLGFAVLVAVLISLTFIPVLGSWLMKPSSKTEPRVVQILTQKYRHLLIRTLNHQKLVIGIGITSMVGAFALFPFLGSEFLPVLDEGTMVVQTEKTPTITLEKSLEQDVEIQKAILEIPEVIGVVARTGADELRLDPMGFYQSDLYLVTHPREKWRNPDPQWLQDRLREKIERIPGINIGFTQPIDMRISEMLTGTRAAVAIKIFGSDLNQLEKKAKKIEEIVSSTPGAVDVLRTPLLGQKMLDIRFMPSCMACSGITQSDVNELISMAVGGVQVSEILQNQRPIPVLLRYPERDRSSVEAIGNLLVKGSSEPVFLKDVARIETSDGPMQILRENGFRMVVVQANVRGRDVVGFVQEVQHRLHEQALPGPGMSISIGGQFENQKRTMKRLSLTIPLALALIFFLLFSSFRSLRQTVLVLANIPLAFVGGIFALWITGMYVSVPASLGFIALFGLASENGVVLLSYYNQLRENGLSIQEAVIEGSARRLRPVLMTAGLTLLGLVPLLMSSGPGSEIQKPLVVVVFGGLLSATLLTLLLLPVAYLLVETWLGSKNTHTNTPRENVLNTTDQSPHPYAETVTNEETP